MNFKKKTNLRFYLGIVLTVFSLSITTSAYSQIVVKGHVYSASDKAPLAGAAVIEEGSSSNGTSAGQQGEFTISVKKNARLVVSFMGYKSVSITAKDGLAIYMDEDVNMMDEIVVTGYTSEKRADILGSVSVVKMKDVKDISSGNIVTALQGRIPGVVISTDGAPGGADYSVLVRGITTINDSSPLYVIDGIQTREHLSTILNPNDVESIQVLKDAASAAIYGTKASNGVIIITTKHGKDGGLNVEFSTQLSAQTVANRLEMLNSKEWGEVYWTASKNDGIVPSHPVYGDGETPVIPEFIDTSNNQRASDTDWQSEGYKTSFTQNYNLSISGGTKRSDSFFGVNYIDDRGMLMNTRFKRYNIKYNSNYNFLDGRIRIGENMNLSRYTEILAPSGIHELLLIQHPLIPVHTVDGNWGGYVTSLSDMNNPIRELEEAKDNTSGNWRAFGNMYVEFEPFKKLIFRSNASIDYRNGFSKSFSPKWREGDRVIDNNSLVVNNNYMYEWIWTNTVSYDFSVSRHNLSFLAGVEAKEYRTEYLIGKRNDFLLQNSEFLYLDAGTGTQTNSNGATEYATYSQFGKINYNYDERYIFSATVRRDASSRFGSQNNAGIFPSISAGWRMSKEPFMRDFTFLNELKLRASWGMNGNDLIDNEATYSKFYINNNNASYDITGSDNSVYPGVVKSRTANDALKWEVTTQTNIGLDAIMLDDRLSFTLDLFNKDTDGMLIDRPYIGVIGEGGTYAYNGASLNNKGFESIITWRDSRNDFYYEISANISHYRNVITSLPDDIYYTWGGGNGVDKTIVGQPCGSWFGYRANGLYKTVESLSNGIEQVGKGLGRIRYEDLNGDLVINDKDRDWLGSSNPKLSGGLNVSMTYKQFDMSFFLSGMIRDAWNNSKMYTDFFQLWLGNHGKNLLNAWDQTANYNSTIPALTLQDLNNEGRASTYFIEDGSYLRMKNIQIGYSVPSSVCQRISMSSARLYLQVQNLFTITRYSGVDPEALGYNYPIPRIFTLGINVRF